MPVYYALINESAVDGSVEVLFGDYDRAVVEGEREAETCPISGRRYNHVTDTEDRVRIVTFPAADDSLIQAYVDQINRPIRAATPPAKPIAPAGTLVGTIPSAYPHLDAEGWDAARRHKMQFDTVTAEGIAAIPDVDLSASQIRYAGIIGAIHVDRQSIPYRYRFSDVMEYAAARFAGDRPATVAHRHAKAAAE